MLTLACRSVATSEAGPLVYRDTHAVEIQFGPDYPFAEPAVRMRTPVFHPHVWASNLVCLGGWTGAEFLDLLVKRLFRILQFDRAYLDRDSVANGDAQRWVDANRTLFPRGDTRRA